MNFGESWWPWKCQIQPQRNSYIRECRQQDSSICPQQSIHMCDAGHRVSLSNESNELQKFTNERLFNVSTQQDNWSPTWKHISSRRRGLISCLGFGDPSALGALGCSPFSALGNPGLLIVMLFIYFLHYLFKYFANKWLTDPCVYIVCTTQRNISANALPADCAVYVGVLT